MIDDLLASARRGASGALVVRGEPGIGKTELLQYARARAADMTVVTATGVEAESEIPFASLAELLRPLLGRLPEIPEAQRVALEGGLALGPPAPADPFAISAATLSLLAAGAEEAPLLALVDDAQWLDAASAQALLFAARRLEQEGVVLLLAIRDGPGSLVDRARLPELSVRGLDETTALELVTGDGRAIANSVARMIVQTARGNPLALVEIPSLLTPSQLEGTEPIVEPLSAGEVLDQAFAREIEALSQPARDALVVAAADDSGEPDVIAAAVGLVGGNGVGLAEAEEAGILDLATARFRHPLLRTAAYHRAPPAARRAAHQALAEALARGGRPEGRAWHLALAASGPDEAAAAALEETGADARRRTGVAAAARAFERSASLTSDPALRARRLVEAARDWVPAGRVDRASVLLEEALPLNPDPNLGIEIDELRALCEFFSGAWAVAHTLLVDAADRVEGSDPGRAVVLLSQAAVVRIGAGEPHLALELSERATMLAERADDAARVIAAMRLVESLVLLSEHDRAIDVFDRLLPSLEAADPLNPLNATQGPTFTLIFFERYAEARRMATRAIAAARQASAPTVLPLAMASLGLVEFRTGNWQAARAAGTDAVRLADETGQVNLLFYPLSMLARVFAAEGRVEECRRLTNRALELAGPGQTPALHFARAPTGLLALGLGDYEGAIGQLESIAANAAETGIENPVFTQWLPDLVEAYSRSGRTREASASLERLELQAERTRLPWVRAAAGRCRGLLAGDDDFEQELAEALRWHAATPTPFERARTELVLGERRRRARRRAEARTPLRSALETFDRLGARPWAERARSELQATGERARRRDSGTEELTAQELQVAMSIAGGSTNREAAAALFLSPKTIEFHLTHIYRKLGLRSRSELARRFAHDLEPVS